MSRYLDVDTVVFDDPVRGSVQIKDIRPIPEEETGFDIELKNGDLLDEIATRKSVFGMGGETQVYRLFDLNVREIIDAGFNLDNMQRLKIPRG